jgi:centrin-2
MLKHGKGHLLDFNDS